MPLPVIDLVGVAYEAPEETRRFLASLTNIREPFTLSVVENASPNQTVRQVLRDADTYLGHLDTCLDFTYVENGTNVGYARAVNQAVHARRPDESAPYLGILNCDVEFVESFQVVADVVDYFESHDDVGVVGPLTTNSDGRLTHAGIFSNGRDTHRQWMAPDNPSVWDIRDVPTVSGATYFVRRSCWDQLTDCHSFQEIAPDAQGAFLPTQHFYEETWCSYHARAHNWRVVYLGTTKMIHQWHRSSPIGSIKMTEAEEYFRKACAQHDIELAW